MLLRLRTFGGLWIENPQAEAAAGPRPRSLALLAICAAAGAKGVSRERALGVLWPNSHPERARHALSQTLYYVRREVGAEVIVSSPDLRLDPRLITSDVDEFLAATRSKKWADAVALYTGAFLDGFYLSDGPEFERWVDDERASLAADAARAFDAAAKASLEAGRHDEAIDTLRRLTRIDPANSRFAAKYMEALAEAGDRAGAVAHGKAHLELLQREFELDPDAELEQLIARLRESAPSVPKRRDTPHAEPSLASKAQPAPMATDAAQLAPVPTEAVVPSLSQDTVATVADVPPARRHWRVGARQSFIVVATVAVALTAIAVVRAPMRAAAHPVLAVGWFQDPGGPDSVATGRVSGDMLATSLARLSELRVIATSRMLELAPGNADTSRAGLTAAARRAGATEIIEGEFVSLPNRRLELDVRRVDLAKGLVRAGYRIAGSDRIVLLDSVTSLIAMDLGVRAPHGSVIQVSTRSAVAFRLYEEGLRTLFQANALAAGRLFRAALREDSSFALAAYYAWRSAALAHDTSENSLAGQAMALAQSAPPGDRLLIVTHVGFERSDVRALASAETLATRYSQDPEALVRAAEVLPDLSRAVRLLNESIALDSLAGGGGGAGDGAICRLCDAFSLLSYRYAWADSDAAMRRTIDRWRTLRPNDAQPWAVLSDWLVGLGQRAAADTAIRRMVSLGGTPGGRLEEVIIDLRLDEFEQADAACAKGLTNADDEQFIQYRWYCTIGLRMQGRFHEARELQTDGRIPRSTVVRHFVESDPNNRAILDFETGRANAAAREFLALARLARNELKDGAKNPRRVPWLLTLAATSFVEAGDTTSARQLVDSIEVAGSLSLFPRDELLHHFVRGLLYSRSHQADAAVREFRQALSSPTFGYTRINYELGETLLELHRASEAIPVVQAALHGGLEGSGLYITRTEMHELLAQLFEAAGQQDSAAAHYTIVARAWASADSSLATRRRTAEQRSRRAGP
jgi:DNA-binding SARP family transcriptional activator